MKNTCLVCSFFGFTFLYLFKKTCPSIGLTLVVQIIQDLDWMDTKTKEKALDKLGKMKERIAYPDELLDEATVEEYHKDLVITEHEYLENQIRMILWSRKRSMSKLRQPVDKNDWTGRASVSLET